MALERLNRLALSEPDRALVQDRAIDAALNDTERLLAQYAADPRSFGGRYVNSDLMKERFPDFAERREGRGRYNMAVHNSAAVLSSEQFRRAIADDGGEERGDALFLTGVPGAGKSFSVQSGVDGAGVPEGVRVLYEGQLANPVVAIDKVRTALDAGLNVEIIAMLPRVEDAFDRTLNRFGENGRGAAMESMAAIHEGLPVGLRALDREFGDKIAIWVHDVRDPRARRALGFEDGLKAWQEELELGPVRERLTARLDQLRGRAGADEDFERQARGQAPFPHYRPLERGGPGSRGAGSDGPRVREDDRKAALLGSQDGAELPASAGSVDDSRVARATPTRIGLAEAEPVALVQAAIGVLEAGGSPDDQLERALANQRVITAFGRIGLTKDDAKAFAVEQPGVLADTLKEVAERLGNGQGPLDANMIAPAGAGETPAPIDRPAADPGLSLRIGDVPASIDRRYHVQRSRWLGQQGFYESQTAKEAAFHDRGHKLVASSDSAAVIADLVVIAEHRQWRSIRITGTEDFRRETWMLASTRGMEVKGYRPTPRDLQALSRRQEGETQRTTLGGGRDDRRQWVASDVVDAHAAADTRLRLSVPFADKDAARAAGAKWDKGVRAWYVDAASPAVERWVPGRDQARAEGLIAGDRNARAQMRVLEAVTAKVFADDPAAVSRVLATGREALASRIAKGTPIPATGLKAGAHAQPVRDAAPAASARRDVARPAPGPAMGHGEPAAPARRSRDRSRSR